MPQTDTSDIPQPITSVATDKQIISGPDNKRYVFSKNMSPERINKYFTKKGWVLGKDGQWLTASGESVKSLTKVGSPPPDTGGNVLKKRQSLDKMQSFTTDVELAGTASLPSILGLIGGMLGRTPGAAIGGGLGEGAKDLVKSHILNEDISPRQYMQDIAIESAKQAGLQKGGEKVGEIFFNQLNKLPHAVVKKGIPLLPSEVEPNGKIMKYVEDLLTNLAPSSKIMAEFKAKQAAAISAKAEKIANGFATFSGTSEQMGKLVQNTLRAQEKQALRDLETLRKTLPAGKQTNEFLAKTPEYKAYVKEFQYQLMRHIVATNKPELIAGYLRTSSAALGETRQLLKHVYELSPELLGKVQNVILRDVIQETLTGSRDPILKGSMQQVFTGGAFKGILDKIGQEKLQAIYGAKGYKALTTFAKDISNVGSTGGFGKFMNLMFVLPLRTGLSVKAVGKVTGMGIVLNRAAKLLTSEDGVRLYENYIRATSSQVPRAISLARDEMITFNEKSDKEYELEKDLAEEEYRKSIPSIGVDRSKNFGSKSWEQNVLQ